MVQKPVIIVDYNSEWPNMFSELEMILRRQLGNLAISIEHVGSTSVHGLAAKPIIDIDVVIESFTLLPIVINKLSSLGYLHQGNLGIEDREAFARIDNKVPYNREESEKPEHYLYVCNKLSKELSRHITFRNILRKHPELVTEYTILKTELSEKYKNNREAYTDGKTDFVITVLNEYGQGVDRYPFASSNHYG